MIGDNNIVRRNQNFKEIQNNYMRKNQIGSKQKKSSKGIIINSSQFSGNTQHNFVSVNELSSVQDGQKNIKAISSIRKKYLLQHLISKLKFLIAPSTSPAHVKQNWSEEHKDDKGEDYQGTLREVLLSQISYKYNFWQVIKIIEALCIVILFWAASTQLIFLPNFITEENQNLFSLYFKGPPCVIIIVKIVLKQIFILRQRSNFNKLANQQEIYQRQIENEQRGQKNYEQNCQSLKDFLISVLYSGICALYLLIHALGSHPFRDIIQSIIVIVFFYRVWNLKDNLEYIYSYVQAKEYKNQWRILVLFFLVLGICHFIALILYCTTYIYPQKNWINSVDKQALKEQTWLAHYTCSIYFAITTMATVGYGDFSPTQLGEMFIVSFIQLFGSAVFGYMINVVGLTVVQINKKNEQFDNYMSTIHKMQNHYQISRQLCQKFKQDIIKSESIKKETPLNETQQTQFFKMIQNSLKQQFILQTNIKVIKKSIFFLTHFTVNFQNQIALKLIRKIYRKNQNVPLTEFDGENIERCMLIINSGSIDIEIANQLSNTFVKKFIKNISPQQGKPTLNVFGYSALILNKDIDLKAFTRDTSVIYLLKRKDVLDCMDKNMLDFQGIAQLRQKMLQYKNVNYIEGLTLMDIQKHYVPNVYFVNKKKKTICQTREQAYRRSSRKSKIKLITLKNYQFRTMMCIDLQQQEQKQNQRVVRTKINNGVNNQKMEFSKVDIDNEDASIKMIECAENLEMNESFFISRMDQVKDYQNFMKKSNVSHLIPKYHEYLKTIRKQKKLLENIKQNFEQRGQNHRLLTYTEGMNCNIKLDD